MKTLQLNNEAFPFGRTAEGEAFAKQLNVRMNAVEQGHRNEAFRYAYCLVAGSCKAEGKSFDLKLEQFIRACPANWYDELQVVMAGQKAVKKKKNTD